MNIKENTLNRFLNYVKTNTISDWNSKKHPSTEIQKDLGKILVSELKILGLEDARIDEYGYVYATLPSNTQRDLDVVGFIAHMDTSPDLSGEHVNPLIFENYDGNDVLLNKDLRITMKTEEFLFLKELKGQTLVTTDGTTLLGADDKAGIAEIMAMLSYFQSNPQIEHGTIKIAFTPDEEIGEGPMFFDLDFFKAKYAYTVDGGKEGIINYENFNAASANVKIRGINIHPGSAKNHMLNSILVAMEYNSLLPHHETPSHTEMYEGFYHLNSISGDVEETKMNYIIRNHDKNKFLSQKETMKKIGDFLNDRYGKNSIEVQIKDSYYNMKDIIEDHMDIIDIAKEAIEMAGMTPGFYPIRGGTDGAQLTYKGLPCPNLATGGWNAHGRYECITAEAMEKCCETLINIVKIIAR